MTRLFHTLALVMLGGMFLFSLDARFAPVQAGEAADCFKGKGDVRGCSQIIKSGRLNGKPVSKKRLTYAYNNRGLAYYHKGQYDSAIADYDMAIKLNPKYAKAYTKRGRTYSRMGQYDRAIADFDKRIKLTPKYAFTYYIRGFVYNKKGDYDRAIADFDTAIKLDPKDARSYFNRGLAYMKKGQGRRAMADYVKAYALDPNLAEAKEQLNRENGACVELIDSLPSLSRQSVTNCQLN